MLKITTITIFFVSFLAYGQSTTQVIKIDANENIEISKKDVKSFSATEDQQKNSMIREKEAILSLITKNSHNIELIIEHQQKLATEISKTKGDTDIDYSGWASILLACVGIIITVMSVILALISFVGYRNFRKSIEASVKKISTEVAKSEAASQIDSVAKKELARLIDEGALAKHLESAVDMIIRGNAEIRGTGFDKYPELDKEDN